MSRALDSFIYLRIGHFIEPHLSRFEDLRRSLRKAGMNISLRMYLSNMIFWSVNTFFISFALFVLIWAIVIQFSLIFIFLFSLLFSLTVAMGFIFWPSYVIGERKRKLESSLPTAAGYMTALASAGVTPDKIFLSMSREDIGMEMVEEAKKISRDVEIFGKDILHAISAASDRSPSPRYSAFLEGIVATFTAGGDLQAYLETSNRNFMQQKLQTEKAFIEALGLVAELFLVLGVVAPIFGMVIIAMLSIMATGGGNSALIIMGTLSYIVIPVGLLMILLMVDGMQPTE